ncbi:hypothetical protein K432DRAFT_304846 [Lepidopterella palustris CBS 459.81]|uniref:NTF2-domain-containing protein n=1 Tax=Lepidopterella palustris CBS 459.81 TaxID=1314670 RepID=A0A8E2E4C4_9PEZI|nr:hypothetical protein K432DRAFT_304846 [Lepidopterella palustris CBS 459.81]
MATIEPTMPVNGNYGSHQTQSYAAMENNYAAANANSALSGASSYGTSSAPSSQTVTGNSAPAEIPKDEVGWYFVEQYYTTLSRSPEKLFLFYNKRSQFVSGVEEEKQSVCIGQRAINDRIKELDFHDCKVRVTNVDSQGSDQNIVIQVIGEISNKGQPHRKFIQTFVLAEQTNGYFVLNDIFRYIAEEPEDEEEQLQQVPTATSAGIQEPAPTAAEPETENLNHSSEIPTSEEEISEVDHKLEDVIHQEESVAREASPPPAEVNGTSAPEPVEESHAEEAPVAAASTAEETPTKGDEEPTVEETAEPEKPKDPIPTPVVSAPKPAAPAATPAAPVKPSVTAAPRTWASLAASANRVATPNVSAPVPTSAPTQPKVAPPVQTQIPTTPSAPPAPLASSAPTNPIPDARGPSPTNSQGDSTGWQTAGPGHSKAQSRSQSQTPQGEAGNRRAYIKNVYTGVAEDALRAALAKFGEIEYLDISRQKNCAFVDFVTPAGFQAALNANPHKVGTEDLYVEERRLRPTGFSNFPRGGMRGGRGGPERTGGQGRGGFNKPDSGRGGFSQRGRGGNVTPRGGRGGAQAV